MHTELMTESIDQSARETAERVFKDGFFAGDENERVREEHSRQTPLELAYALRIEGCDGDSIRNFALRLRAIGDREPIEPRLELTERQQRELAALCSYPNSPESLREVLSAATPHIRLRRDLYAMLGVLLTAADAADAIEDTIDLA